MKRCHYVEESDDAYAEFLKRESHSLWALRWWPGQAQSFSHRYDAQRAE